METKKVYKIMQIRKNVTNFQNMEPHKSMDTKKAQCVLCSAKCHAYTDTQLYFMRRSKKVHCKIKLLKRVSGISNFRQLRL